MPRATNAPASRRRRRSRLDQASGFSGSRSKLFRQATEAVNRGMRLATVHRQLKKLEYRSLWVVRVSAACRERGIRYGRFIEALAKANILLNRKMLSEIAIHDPDGFNAIVEQVKADFA